MPPRLAPACDPTTPVLTFGGTADADDFEDELVEQGYGVSHMSVARTLHDMGYSLHALRKNQEGSEHPDRNAQFEYINALVQKLVPLGIRHIVRTGAVAVWRDPQPEIAKVVGAVKAAGTA